MAGKLKRYPVVRADGGGGVAEAGRHWMGGKGGEGGGQ